MDYKSGRAILWSAVGIGIVIGVIAVFHLNKVGEKTLSIEQPSVTQPVKDNSPWKE